MGLARVVRATLLVVMATVLAGTAQADFSAEAHAPFVAINQGSCRYDSLTAAVMAAQPGDTLFISPGTWPGSVTIDKDLTLRGGYGALCTVAGSGTTTLSGMGSQVINVIAGRVELADLVLTDGEATFGAALRAINGSQVILNHTLITGNRAIDRGGGVFIDDNARVTFTNDSDITENRAQTRGGGLFISPGGFAVLHAGSDLVGNATYGAQGGGGAWVGGTLVLEDGAITGNRAPNGGGITVMGQGSAPAQVTLRHTQVTGNVTATDVGHGGGVLVADATLRLEHSLVQSNTAARGGGIAVAGASAVTLTNNLVTGNLAAASSAGGALDLTDNSAALVQQNTISTNGAQAIVAWQPTNSLQLANNVIWGHAQGSVTTTGGSVSAACNDTEFGPLAGPGNIAANPRFVAPLDHNYRLRNDSPALDRCAAAPTAYDLDRRPRPQGAASDMGAYEGVGCPADINQDGRIDLRDVQLVAGHFEVVPTYDGVWDYDVVQNGVVEVQDIAVVAALWGRYCW